MRWTPIANHARPDVGLAQQPRSYLLSLPNKTKNQVSLNQVNLNR